MAGLSKDESSLMAHPANDTTGWSTRHNQAVNYPRGIEKGFILMVQAWELYASSMLKENGWKVGEDGYCGEYWEDIGRALIKLLSGPIGTRLDAGTIDKFIRQVAQEYGATDFDQ